MCPLRRADLTTRELEGETLILDRQHEHVHQLNTSASYVWQRCDGQTTVREIAESMAQDFGIGLEEAERDVEGLVSRLKELGLLGAE